MVVRDDEPRAAHLERIDMLGKAGKDQQAGFGAMIE